MRLADEGATAAAAAGPDIKDSRNGNGINARLLVRNWRRLNDFEIMRIYLFALEGFSLNEGVNKLIQGIIAGFGFLK